MPATQAKGGFGTKLYRDDGAGVFVAITEVLDINGPELSLMVEDATNMDSPTGDAEKVSLGVKEAGDITLQVHALQDDVTQASLYTDRNTGTKRNWRIVYPSGTKRLAFAGFVTRIGHAFPVKGKMVQDVTIAISGPVVREAN